MDAEGLELVIREICLEASSSEFTSIQLAQAVVRHLGRAPTVEEVDRIWELLDEEPRYRRVPVIRRGALDWTYLKEWKLTRLEAAARES